MEASGRAARWLVAVGGLLLLSKGSCFELKCFQGQGTIQPAPLALGARAMTFPNDQWNQAWLDEYLSVHPELKTYDAFGFETGYSVSFDFDAGQPPDEERFRAFIVTGTGIPDSSVEILSYRQSMTWRLRLPSGKFDNSGQHLPAGPVASKYANVVGPRSVTCSNIDEEDNRNRCDSDPCECFTANGVHVCAGAPGCAGHAILRYMVTQLAAVESDVTQEDIAAYNTWLGEATAEMTVLDSRLPARATQYRCVDGEDCYPSVEANVTLTYTGDKFHINEGYAGSLFRQNLKDALNLSLAAIDPGAAMQSIDADVYLSGITNLPTTLTLPWLDPAPLISTTVEYKINNLRHCNSSVVAIDRFDRFDLNDDRKLDMNEFERMLYEMGRRHENGRAGIGVDATTTVAEIVDSDGDNMISYEELLLADARRDGLQAKSVPEVVSAAGWIIAGALSAVTDDGGGLAAISTSSAPELDDGLLDVTKEAVGKCIVDSGLDNTYGQKQCIITELLGIPEVESSEVRCVRKESADLFSNTVVEYQCVSWEMCGTVPDPAYATQPASSQATFEYDCEFSGCTPDALRYGNAELTPALNDFRCWDSCRLASGMDECAHIEQRSTHCRHGEPCFFVDTLDPSVSSDREAELKLLNLSMTINNYAGECRPLFGDVGYVEECRHMRCHAMGSANGHACDNAVPPPCRSVCEGYIDHITNDMSVHPDVSGSCSLDEPPPSPTSGEYWSYVHCQALLSENCSAFPPDSELETGGCTRPARYEGGMPCVREAECLSNSCPLAHSDDSPVVEGEGRVCCNFGLNGCSGHGVCTSHHDSTTPKSIGPRMPVEYGGCVCELDWTGVDCSKWMMPPNMFYIIIGVFASMTFGSLTWCTFWFAWYWGVHEPPPPPKAQKPPLPPPKPKRDSDSEEDASDDTDEEVGCRLRLVVCRCKDLPPRKGIQDTYVSATLSGRKKRTTTCRNGGNCPSWRPPPATPGLAFGTPPETPSTAGGQPTPAPQDATGEELSWAIPRGDYKLTLESWNDESRFQYGNEALVDTLVCRTTLRITDPLVHPIPGHHGSDAQDVDCWDKDGNEAGVMRVRLFWDDPGSPAGFNFGRSSPALATQTTARAAGSSSAKNVQILKVMHDEAGIDHSTPLKHVSAAAATSAAVGAPRPPTGPAPEGVRQRASVAPLPVGLPGASASTPSAATTDGAAGETPDDLDGIEQQIMETSGQSKLTFVAAKEAEGKEDVLAQAEAAVLESTV